MHFLGIDYGAARTGFAVGDDATGIAFPRTVIAGGEKALLEFIKKTISEEKIEAIVLGLPKTLAGKESDSTRAVRMFAKKLKVTFPDIPVYFQDEIFSTKAIQQGTVAKDKIDAAAAALILQSYLDAYHTV